MTRVLSGAGGRALGLFLLCQLSILALAEEISTRSFSVLASAVAQENPPRIVLDWVGDSAATGYTIYRRTSASSWQQIATLTASTTTFTDASVSVGTRYEYQFIKSTSGNYSGYGYLSAGIRIPATAHFGKLVLVVENSLAQVLAPELRRLQDDIRAEGWDVVQRNVGINDSPGRVKQIIKEVYDADPGNVRAVFLFGHVPVPYSGDIMPDSHLNHKGAWPADTYYADMDGVWTDNTVNTVSAERDVNWNVPGDGKFDQSEIPSTLELWVGRVDLSRMTCYANKVAARSEVDLMRQYLNKNHAFRSGQMQVQRRGLICDNVIERGIDPVSSSGWRNFSGLVGPNNITEAGWLGYLPVATSGSYLWSFASGGGSYYTCAGVGTADDFALQEVRVVFTMFLGSYFGDWNNESNFLRASLGSGDVLAVSYAGFPQMLYFPMALGEPIGHAMWLTQHNGPEGLYPPFKNGARQVHIALLGDPTLRMHPVLPPANATATLGSGVSVNWLSSPDSSIHGYMIYRASTALDSFRLISGSALVTGTSFHDPSGAAGNAYMVRAVKLEQSPSGTYFNPSAGIFATAASGPQTPPNPPSGLAGTALSTDQIRVTWADNSNNESGFRVYRKQGPNGAYATFPVAANTTSFTDNNLSAGAQYFYKVHSFNAAGTSQDTAEISVSTLATTSVPNTAAFVKSDSVTGGSWKGIYGSDGALAPYSDFSYPPSAQINGYLNYPVIWQEPSSSPAALERRLSVARFGTYFHNPTAFFLYLQFKDTGKHRVSFYFCDFERFGRQQKIELFDFNTGELLASTSIANFQNGLYSTWDLSGKITVKFSNMGPHSAVLSGIFFDPVTTAPKPESNSGSSASFVKADSLTSGSWKGVYGAEAQIAPYSDFSFPTNVQINAYQNFPLVWENPSGRLGALQKRSSTSRFATCWQNTSPFFFYFQFKDTTRHRVSFYFHDFEALGRRQTVEFFDYSTGALLGSTTVSSFQNGLYSTWDLKGKITVKVTPLGPGSAMLSGIFFDPAPADIPEALDAARFVGTDSGTAGNWNGVFGSQGAQISGDTAQLPAYVNVTFSGKTDHIWNFSPGESAALQRLGGNGRIAACWYAPDSFDIAINITDGLTHKISFYSLDWDMQNRSQRIEAFNGVTGELLHSTNISNFGNGMYHSYDVKGSIRFRFARTGPWNAVISGIFFDSPSAPL